MIDRQRLLKLSRERVHNEGYNYRKGRTCSKHFSTDSSTDKPKKPKISEDIRRRRISELEKDINKTSQQIKLKEKRRSIASAAHQYKDCDKLTSQISQLRFKLRGYETELRELRKKERKSKWYKDKRRASDSSTTPLPGTTPSPTPFQCPNTPALSSPTTSTFSVFPSSGSLSPNQSSLFSPNSSFQYPRTLNSPDLSLPSPHSSEPLLPSPRMSSTPYSSDSESVEPLSGGAHSQNDILSEVEQSTANTESGQHFH